MRMVDPIEKKEGWETSCRKEIEYIVTNYTNGKIPDYQVSALLMAIFIKT